MKIAVHGINGKMGRAIALAVLNNQHTELVGASVRQGHAWDGKQLSKVCDIDCDLKVTSNLEVLCQGCDVIIDFTRPDATLALLPICQKYNRAVMIGTTGFTEETQKWIHQMAVHIPIVLAANTSLGVNLLIEMSKMAAKALVDKDWDIDIFEMHHRRKEDAPSGTALRLGEVISKAQGTALSDRYVYPYQSKRENTDIGFSVARGGDVIGEHTVFFINDHERIELTHRAQDRSIFARGAVTAAQWLVEQKAGFYGMSDVLGLDKQGD